jgi:hypothetical protein
LQKGISLFLVVPDVHFSWYQNGTSDTKDTTSLLGFYKRLHLVPYSQ